MTELADRTESIFAAAVALPSTTERAALLERECANDLSLRGRIEALLRAHDRAGHMLDRPIAELKQTVAHIPSEQPGAVIAGRYKLLEAIGEGGMGTVWVAEQTEPVRRKVALKLIKAGMDSKSVLARFDAERQALAVMDHPNIAKVLDGGLTDAGRPYFVMEYVKGMPITEYCDATRLSVPERLNLFVQVCHAVQHAHQKGIIHRDLKPSNILVAPYDDRPVPKVIDFGLAKAMHQSLTERTLHTAHETALGTPLYMSPEQAQLNNLDVDTRSDIYSLGVLLYELLTGTTPLEKQRFKEAAWDEIKRIIREEEPPRPSTRLSSANTLASLAAGRQIEPARLTKLVRGELDWIVMKSLEKDRTRRYDTANGFAADVQRYLAGEPVQAVPPSAGYRLRKFVNRNRRRVAVACLLLAALLAGITGTTIGLIRATVAEKKTGKALIEVTEEKARTQTALGQAREADAESRRGLARQYIDRGGKLLADGNYADALTWFAAAWEKEADVIDAEREAIHRLRLTATAQVAPKPTQVWNHGASGMMAMWLTPDSRRVMTFVSPSRNRRPDGTVRVWDLETGRPVTPPLPHHNRRHGLQAVGDVHFDAVSPRQPGVAPLSLSRDGRRMVTTADSPSKGERSETVIARVWDTETGQPMSPEIRCGEHGASISPDGTRLLTVTSVRETIEDETSVTGGEARLWDVRTGIPVCPPLVMPCGGVSEAEFVADGTRVLTIAGFTAMLWDVDTGKPLTPFLLAARGAPQPGLQGAFVLAGIAPSYVSGDRQFVPWNPDRTCLVAAEWPANRPSPPTGKETVAQVALLPMRVWDLRTGQPLSPPLELQDRKTPQCEISPDGKRLLFLATVNGQPAFRVADASTGKTLATQGAGPGERPISAAFFSPIAQWVYTTTAGLHTTNNVITTGITQDWVRVWVSTIGRPVTPPLPFEEVLGDIRISNDGLRLLLQGRPSAGVSAQSSGVQVRSVPSGQVTTPVIRHPGQTTHGVFSADGRQLLTYGGTHARVWDANTGQPRTPILAHARQVAAARFTPDGRSVVTACEDGRVCVWPARCGEPETRSLAPGESVCYLWPDATLTRLLTLSHPHRLHASGLSAQGTFSKTRPDNELKLWDMTTGQGQVLERYENLHERLDLTRAFSPSGRWVVAFRDSGLSSSNRKPTGLKCWDARTFASVADIQTAARPIRVWFDRDETVIAYELAEPDKLTGKRTFAVRLPGGEPAPAVPEPTEPRSTGPTRTIRILNDTTAQIDFPALDRDVLIEPPGGVVDCWDPPRGRVVMTASHPTLLFSMQMFGSSTTAPNGTAWFPREMRKFAVWTWDRGSGQPVLPPLTAQGVTQGQLTTEMPRSSGFNLRARMSEGSDGVRVFYPAADGLRVWHLPPDTRTPAEWVRLATAFGGNRVGTGGLESLPEPEWAAARSVNPAAVGRTPPLIEWLTRESDEAEDANDILGLRIVLKRLIDMEPNNWVHYRRLGKIAPNDEEGIRINTRAIELGATDWQAWHNRGLAYFRLGRWEEAEADFTTAVKMMTEKDGRPWKYLLLTRLARGDLAGYREAFADAESFFGPDFNKRDVFDALEFAVLVPDVVSDPKRLLEWKEQNLVTVDPSRGQHTGDLHFRMGMYEKALPLFLNLEKTRIPGRIDQSPLLAMTYHHLGQHDKAREAFARAADLHAKYIERKEPAPASTGLNMFEGRIVFSAYYKEACALIGELSPREITLLVLEEKVKVTKVEFGPEHSNTLSAMWALAEAHREELHFDRAIPLIEEMWKIRKQNLPEGDLTRIDTQNQLGLLLFFAGRFDEAEPHLLGSYRDGMNAKDFPRPRPQNFARRLVCLYAEWGKTDEVAQWQAELNKVGGTSESQLASSGLVLLEASRFRAAELLLRDCLAIREKTRPDDWTTFDAKSMLGRALLGQKKYADAEPLLLAGYEGLKEREAKILPQSNLRVVEALDRLIELYTALDQPDEVKKWQTERAKVPIPLRID